jgi:hypothetical protein
MALLYGRAGRLTAKNGGFRPGQCQLGGAELEALRLEALALLTGRGAEETRRGQASAGAAGLRAAAVARYFLCAERFADLLVVFHMPAACA